MCRTSRATASLSRTDMSYGGSRMTAPRRASAHSLAARANDIGYGYGWRSNYAQSIEACTVSGTSYYRWTDGDGTEKYFVSANGVWKDELGYGYTLTGLRQRIHHHGQEEQHHGVLVRGTAHRRKGRLRERHKHHVGRQPRYGPHGRRGAALCLHLRRRPPHAAHLYRRGFRTPSRR